MADGETGKPIKPTQPLCIVVDCTDFVTGASILEAVVLPRISLTWHDSIFNVEQQQ